MKYFLDTEFIEGFKKPIFGKRRHFIDLISIGIVCEDGRKFSAISSEYNAADANQWVCQNVIAPLYTSTVNGDARRNVNAYNFNKHYGMKNTEILSGLLEFLGCWRDQHFWRAPEGIEIYGYYADYDWVLFCSLFGRMIDLPKGFPMYCRDLKQIFDERAESINQIQLSKMLVYGTNWQAVGELPKKIINIDDYPLSSKIELLKTQPGYPVIENEHNAIDDAKWNYELYKFLKPLNT